MGCRGAPDEHNERPTYSYGTPPLTDRRRPIQIRAELSWSDMETREARSLLLYDTNYVDDRTLPPRSFSMYSNIRRLQSAINVICNRRRRRLPWGLRKHHFSTNKDYNRYCRSWRGQKARARIKF